MNNYLLLVGEWLYMPSKNATIIWEDNQPLLGILNAGHITGRVKHMAVTIAIYHQEIKLGSCVPKKIPGILNPSGLGTKPLAAPICHRLS